MAELDTNEQDAVTVIVDVTGKTHAAVYVNGVDGVHDKHIVALILSPDEEGDNWFEEPQWVTGLGFFKTDICALRARVCVKRAEGVTSLVNVETVFN